MRKDILALAIVKKGGGGGQLDDGLYNVENGNAANLVNKVAMSAANGKMFASGDRSTTNGTMYYLAGSPYEIRNIQGPEIDGSKIYYLWGMSDSGVIKREYVERNKYYYADPNGNTMLTEIPTPVTPSGSLSITQNGTYNVADKAQVVVNTPQPSGTKYISSNGIHNVAQYENANVQVPETIIQADLEYNRPDFDLIRTLSRDNGVYPYTVITNGNEIVVHMYATGVYEGHECDMKNMEGGWDGIPEGFAPDEPCFVIAAFLPSSYTEQTQFHLTLDATYIGYDGPYTEEEVTQMWEQKIQAGNVVVFDLEGKRVGYISDISSIHVEFRSDS